VPRGLRSRRGEELFAAIAERECCLHHPFDSFDPVSNSWPAPPKTRKCWPSSKTLYRISGDSPITRALMQAAENGKHVTALSSSRRASTKNETSAGSANGAIWRARRVWIPGSQTHCKLSLVCDKKAIRYGDTST